VALDRVTESAIASTLLAASLTLSAPASTARG